MSDLQRFVDAQAGSVYATALAELAAGDKRTHWMWFIFPQIAGLGRSATARLYALFDRYEAGDYFSHPVLGARLLECTEAVLRWAGERTAEAIFGATDAIKLRSSMTLFEAVSPATGSFASVIDAFFDGVRDPATLERL